MGSRGRLAPAARRGYGRWRLLTVRSLRVLALLVLPERVCCWSSIAELTSRCESTMACSELWRRATVAGADPVGDLPRQYLQCLVADPVAEAVVALLQLVEVDRHHAQRQAGAPAARELIGEPLVEAPVVEQAGQQVGGRRGPQQLDLGPQQLDL